MALYFENPIPLYLAPAAIAVAVLLKLACRKTYTRTYRAKHPLLDYVAPKRGKAEADLLVEALVAVAIVAVALALAEPYAVYSVVETLETEKTGELQFTVKPPVVLVVDSSGSMEGSKIEEAKKAVLAFTDRVSRKLDVGLVVFSSMVVEAIPPTSNVSAVREAIVEIKASGGTMYSYPMKVVYEWLKPYAEFNISSYVVFASDGLPADASAIPPLLEKYREAGIVVYAVFIGADENGYRLLAEIAENTGGEAYRVVDIDELVEKFSSIAGKIVDIVEANVSVSLKYEFTKTVKQDYAPVFSAISLVAVAALFTARYRKYRVTF